MGTQVLLYLPVLHAGYDTFLDRHRDTGEVLLLGTSFGAEFPVLRKELRALDPDRATRYLSATGPPARVVQRHELAAAVTGTVLVVPDEKLMRELVARYRLDAGRRVRFERTFLRWDRTWSTAARPAGYDGRVATGTLAQELLGVAVEQTQYSSDWWRQVGAVAARNGAILDRSHNEHQPTGYTPYLDGDPRNEFSRGYVPACPPPSMLRPHLWPGPLGSDFLLPAPTCTCPRSPALDAPGWWPPRVSAGASSPNRTPCSIETSFCAPLECNCTGWIWRRPDRSRICCPRHHHNVVAGILTGCRLRSVVDHGDTSTSPAERWISSSLAGIAYATPALLVYTIATTRPDSSRTAAPSRFGRIPGWMSSRARRASANPVPLGRAETRR
jgi:hypothetical protein